MCIATELLDATIAALSSSISQPMVPSTFSRRSSASSAAMAATLPSSAVTVTTRSSTYASKPASLGYLARISSIRSSYGSMENKRENAFANGHPAGTPFRANVGHEILPSSVRARGES